MPLLLNLGYFSIIRLATLILSLSISVYLFSIRGKSTSTIILACAFLGATLFNVSMLMEHANPYYWQPYGIQNLVRTFLLAVGASITILCFLLFSYYFPHFQTHEKREYRIVLVISGAINVGILALTFYNFIYLQIVRSYFEFEAMYYRIFAGSLGAQFCLVIFLLCRKTVRLSAGESRSMWFKLIKPVRVGAKAARALAVILFLPLIAALAYLLRYLGVLPPLITIHFVWYVFLLFYASSIIIYLNNTEETTTFQVKIVGGSLVVVFIIMSVVAIVVGRSYEKDYINENFISDNTTIHFAPNHFGSYDITRAPFRYDADMGSRTGLGYGERKSIALPFSFPFYEQKYTNIHVLNGPMIFLGEEIREKGWGGYHPQPVIAPIIMNLDPSSGGEVFLKSEDNRETITWYRVPEFEKSSQNTVQLALSADGTFDISYIELHPGRRKLPLKIDVMTTANITGSVLGGRGERGASFEPRLIGIHPGGRYTQLQPIRFMKDLPYKSSTPGPIFEAYDIDYYQYIHDKMAPLAFILLGSSIFILFFFPLILKNSLIKPLHVLYSGMEKVNRGNMEVSISPRFNDEIGFLTRSFNQMLHSVKKAESNFRTLAENASDGIFIILDGGSLIYANKRASEITGFDNTELIGASLNDLIHDKTYEEMQWQQEDSSDRQKTPKHYETFMHTKGGEEVSVEVTISRTDWHGKRASVIVVRDISERKRSEEQQRLQQQQLMLMDKLTSLGILVAGVAHEINNPNQTILSNASFLVRASSEILSILKSYNDDNEDFLIAGLDYVEFQTRFSEIVSGIERCSNRIDGIVGGLRAFSRDEPQYVMTSLNINSVIESAVKLLDNYIKNSTRYFSIKLEKNVPSIKGNAQRLEQVIINLIMNACQSLADREQTISVQSICDASRGTILIIIRDSGAGIEDEDLTEIKKPFFTTKRAQGGTGLGLYVSESIITEHGGTLVFESEKGKGTTATVSLPVLEGK
jgi:PAS domain S-box-containing protein